MRCSLFLTFSCLLLLLQLNFTAAWEQADYDIFDLVDEVEQLAGDKENFYTFLGTERNANQKEITKGYRKQSLLWHPDKNTSPEAQKRQKLIGVVAAILRDEASRTRYDFFLKNGVPKWRGTGYYYRRHRPGLGAVIIGCIVFGSFLQYLASWVLCLRRRSLFRELVAEEAEAALRKTPRRSMKRTTSKESISELDQSDSVSQSGRSTPVPVSNEPLDPEDDPIIQFPAPRATDVLIIKLPRAIFNGIISFPSVLVGMVTGKKKVKSEMEDEYESDDEVEVSVKGSKRSGKKTKENAEDQEESGNKSNVAGKKSVNRRIVNRTASNPKFVPTSTQSAQSTVPDEWTKEEQSRLSELTTRFPPMTQGRWTLISRALGREEKDVILKAKSMNLKK